VTVFVDPASWPRHGRFWGHLVSDTSPDELHAVARAAGIPDRAFDRDHYDVPGELQPRLVELDAVQVTAHELVRRLRGSGLRVTGRERRSDATAAETDIATTNISDTDATTPHLQGPTERSGQ
jgi:hypothetical protein